MDSKIFGDQLKFYRTTRGGHQRNSQEWLGKQLGRLSDKAAIDFISGVERGKRLMTRREILEFGRIYQLDFAELSELMQAAETRAQQPSSKLEYRPVHPEEIAPPVYGPSELPRWSGLVTIAQQANTVGDIRTAKAIAHQVMDEILSAQANRQEFAIEWIDTDVEWATHLWVAAWTEFTFSLGTVTKSEDIPELIEPYIGYLSQLKRSVDPQSVALIEFTESNIAHCLGLLDERRQASVLPKVRADVAAMSPTVYKQFAQRLLIIHSAACLRDWEVVEQIETGLSLLEEDLPEPDSRGSSHILEGIGRAMLDRPHLATQLGKDASQFLMEAETYSKEVHDQLGYVMSLRSQIVLGSARSPRGFDRDYLEDRVSKALAIADFQDWKRKSKQVRDIASQLDLAV